MRPSKTVALGSALTALHPANDRAKVADHGLEAPRLQPAACLLIDRLPGWKVSGQHAPRRSCTGHPAQGIEHFAQFVLALRCLLIDQRQIWRRKAPLLVCHVRRVLLALIIRRIYGTRYQVHNTL